MKTILMIVLGGLILTNAGTASAQRGVIRNNASDYRVPVPAPTLPQATPSGMIFRSNFVVPAAPPVPNLPTLPANFMSPLGGLNTTNLTPVPPGTPQAPTLPSANLVSTLAGYNLPTVGLPTLPSLPPIPPFPPVPALRLVVSAIYNAELKASLEKEKEK